MEFLQNLKNLRCPTGYVSNLYNRITGGKLGGLKSHDYHILLQQLLPVCLRNTADKEVLAVIIRLSRLFHRICSKVVDLETELQLLKDATEVLSSLERVFPPSFYIVEFHLQHPPQLIAVDTNMVSFLYLCLTSILEIVPFELLPTNSLNII